jgi:hypothetical protein
MPHASFAPRNASLAINQVLAVKAPYEWQEHGGLIEELLLLLSSWYQSLVSLPVHRSAQKIRCTP